MIAPFRTIVHEGAEQQIHGVRVVQATPYSMCSQLKITISTITISINISTTMSIITSVHLKSPVAIQKTSATEVAARLVWIA